jgi:hypothetical protein
MCACALEWNRISNDYYMQQYRENREAALRNKARAGGDVRDGLCPCL